MRHFKKLYGKIKIHGVRYGIPCLNNAPMDVKVMLPAYLLPLPTSHSMRPTTRTTTSIPTHIPALKIPPTTSQELKVIAIARTPSHNNK